MASFLSHGKYKLKWGNSSVSLRDKLPPCNNPCGIRADMGPNPLLNMDMWTVLNVLFKYSKCPVPWCHLTINGAKTWKKDWTIGQGLQGAGFLKARVWPETGFIHAEWAYCGRAGYTLLVSYLVTLCRIFRSSWSRHTAKEQLIPVIWTLSTLIWDTLICYEREKDNMVCWQCFVAKQAQLGFMVCVAGDLEKQLGLFSVCTVPFHVRTWPELRQ